MKTALFFPIPFYSTYAVVCSQVAIARKKMAVGPVLIFDKSTLQALNPDEAVWLDNFYLTNITPLFFVETLADLEKSVRGGRTPEDVVGNLAHKTPDGGSCPNAHHTTLLEAELCAGEELDMRNGRPILRRGRHVTLGDKTSVIFEESPEAEALRRWQRKEFLDVERLMAKQWRLALSNIDYHKLYEACQTWFDGKQKPKSLPEVKIFTDHFIDGPMRQLLDRNNFELCPRDTTILNVSSGQVGNSVGRARTARHR